MKVWFKGVYNSRTCFPHGTLWRTLFIFSSQVSNSLFKLFKGPRPLEPKEIDGLLVPSSKAYTLLNDRLITGKPFRSEPAQEERVQVKPFIHASLIGLVGWLWYTAILF